MVCSVEVIQEIQDTRNTRDRNEINYVAHRETNLDCI